MTYEAYKANQEALAAAWLEEHAYAMTEDRPDQSLQFGAEYYDLEALNDDADGLDYYEFMGLFAVSESKSVKYVDNGTLETRKRAVRDDGYNAGHVQYLAPTTNTVDRVATEVLPYRGQPVECRAASAKRATTYPQHVCEQKALADMPNKDAQKARRYAKKHQVTISTAIDALRAAGKI
jgi:hypothetical protein